MCTPSARDRPWVGRKERRGNTRLSSRAKATTMKERMHCGCDGSDHGDRGADADEIMMMTGIDHMQNDDDDSDEGEIRPWTWPWRQVHFKVRMLMITTTTMMTVTMTMAMVTVIVVYDDENGRSAVKMNTTQTTTLLIETKMNGRDVLCELHNSFQFTLTIIGH